MKAEAERARAGDPVPTDSELVQRAARGDRAALGLLYDRYAPYLLALGRRLLSDRREAEDVLHDVFLEAFRAAGQYEEARGSVRAWLLTRMRSRCLDRKKAPLARRVVPTDELHLPEPQKGAEEDPFLGPDRARVRAALGALPEEQRIVLVLGYFEGLSSSEIAEQLTLPVGTVKSRVAAALGKLRSALAEGHGKKEPG
jgi:RNA polymerase sigma-70 factor (ECF subfamily)